MESVIDSVIDIRGLGLTFEREAVEAFNSELRIISLAERPTDDSELPETYSDALAEAEVDAAVSLAAAVEAELRTDADKKDEV